MTPAGGDPEGGDAGRVVSAGTWELLGTPFRIGCTSAAVGAAVAELFQAFARVAEAAAPPHRFLVVDGCGHHGNDRCGHTEAGALDVSGPPAVALSWLLTAVNASAIDGFTGLAIHAGVLAAGRSAIAFPAPSGTGKTTLAAAGLLAGFDYVSDEALCIEPGTDELVPYPRALALSSWSRHALGLAEAAAVELDGGEVAVPPHRLGAAIAVPPLELAHVVELDRRPDGRPGPSVLTPAARPDAMTWLLERSFNHYKRPAESFGLAAALARGARAWRLDYGDPLEAAALLRDRLG
ncbi:MAG: hypothetical protein ACR2MO_02785 [Acidimicrobiales bacterium]